MNGALSLWEENDYTEHEKSCFVSCETEQSGSIADIEILRGNENSNITINKKIWSRRCPKCGTEKVYKHKHNYVSAIENNLLCPSCCGKGRITSEETKKLLSKALSGKNSVRYGKPGTNLGKKFSVEHKRKISESQKGRPWPKEYREKMLQIFASESCRTNKRNGTIKRILRERLHGSFTNRSYNPSACQYFDKLNQENRWKLQHAENGGEVGCIGYFLDAYDKDRNIVVEYDESGHYLLEDNRWVLKRKDVERMKRIINHLQCKFYRYNERTDELSRYDVA